MEVFYKHFSLRACFLALWITLVQARIHIVSIPEKPLEGQSVIFSVERVQGDISKAKWYRGVDTQESSRIFTFSPGSYMPQENGRQFTNREFGYHNGSIRITGLRPSDAGQYNVKILLRPQETLKASVQLQFGGSPAATATMATMATTATTATRATSTQGTSPVKEGPKQPSMVGWIVAGVLIGALLCGVLVAIMAYRFVLRKSEPSTGVTGKLDQGARISPPSDHDDKEPVYDLVGSPVETRKDQLPIFSGPLPPLAGTCPKLDSNYTDLLHRNDSIYSEIKR